VKGRRGKDPRGSKRRLLTFRPVTRSGRIIAKVLLSEMARPASASFSISGGAINSLSTGPTREGDGFQVTSGWVGETQAFIFDSFGSIENRLWVD
jgi:hypothetical protein